MKTLNATEIKDYLYKFYDSNEVDLLALKNPDGLIRLYHDVAQEETTIGELLDYTGKLLVESPDGFVPVKSIVKKTQHEILSVNLSNGKSIKTSPFHMFESRNGIFISSANLKPGIELISNSGTVTVESIVELGYKDDVYDLAVEHENHRYYTDDVSSHNSGAGKSLFLQNMGVNWAQAGLNVVYITLELSENLTGMRIDAMIAGIETRGVLKDIDNVAMKVKNFYRKYKGELRLKQMPNGCTAHDIRAYIKELEVQTGKRIDAVLVDYLDLMMPVSARVSPSDQFVKDKFISEELRNMAVELNILCVTASQLNRGSYEEVEFDPSHIAGGISKVNTADNVIGIFTSQAMRESGRYQIQFMKTRSSAGVGSRVDLAFSPVTLRISDLDEGEDDALTSSTKNVMSQLRQSNTVKTPAQGTSPALSDKRNKTDTSDPGQGVGQRTTQLRNLLKGMDN